MGLVGNDYFPHAEHVICHHHLKATDLQNKSSISVSVRWLYHYDSTAQWISLLLMATPAPTCVSAGCC